MTMFQCNVTAVFGEAACCTGSSRLAKLRAFWFPVAHRIYKKSMSADQKNLCMPIRSLGEALQDESRGAAGITFKKTHHCVQSKPALGYPFKF